VQPKVTSAEEALPTLIEDDVDLTAEQQAHVADVFGKLESITHYELLGVPRAADKKAIKRAYYDRTSDFHPDRYFRKQLGSFKGMMQAIFAKMTEAHDVLCDTERRAAYDAELTANAPPPAPPVPTPAPPEPAPRASTAPLDDRARREALARKLLGGRRPTPPTFKKPQ
jgi:curved DNA-binding protein CbpA